MEPKKELSLYLNSDEVKNRFIELVGNKPQAEFFISNALVAIANDEKLQQCSRDSIFTSIFRAASLRLSCDPTAKQAYLVPMWNKKKKATEAVLWVGYKGLYDMAIRTGFYRRIDTYPIYEGMTVQDDYVTGKVNVGGSKESKTIIGWLCLFEMNEKFNNMFKYLYMEVDEIHEHAKQYSQTYGFDNSPWKTATKDMEKKTVLKKLLSQSGYFDFADVVAMQELTPEDMAPLDVEIIEPPRKSIAQNMAEMGFGGNYPEDDDVIDASPATTESEQIREMILAISKEYDAKEEASIEFRGFVAGVLSSMLKSDKDRYAMTEYLTGFTSLKDVPAPMVYAIRDWLALDENNEPSKAARQGAEAMLRQAIIEEGQLEMPGMDDGKNK